jgi:hypothetical protein
VTQLLTYCAPVLFLIVSGLGKALIQNRALGSLDQTVRYQALFEILSLGPDAVVGSMGIVSGMCGMAASVPAANTSDILASFLGMIILLFVFFLFTLVLRTVTPSASLSIRNRYGVFGLWLPNFVGVISLVSSVVCQGPRFSDSESKMLK